MGRLRAALNRSRGWAGRQGTSRIIAEQRYGAALGGLFHPTFPGYRSCWLRSSVPEVSRSNEIRSQPASLTAKTARCSAPLGRNSLLTYIVGPISQSGAATRWFDAPRTWPG